MKRRTVIGSVGAAALGVVGVSAYTSATVSRAASLTVEGDKNAVLQFKAGTGQDDGVSFSNNELQLDGNGQGLNQNAVFDYGAFQNPGKLQDSNAAFKMTNGGTNSRKIKVELTETSTSPASNHDLEVAAYDGSSSTQIGEGDNKSIGTISSGSDAWFAFRLTTAGNTNAYDGDLIFRAVDSNGNSPPEP